jgi:hypothetical protein
MQPVKPLAYFMMCCLGDVESANEIQEVFAGVSVGSDRMSCATRNSEIFAYVEMGWPRIGQDPGKT